jgi:hypothetical protein
MAALQKLLQARNVMFQHNHGKPMSCKGTAQLLSNTLYYKRFFPYYTFNLCAGLDEEGRDPWVAVLAKAPCLYVLQADELPLLPIFLVDQEEGRGQAQAVG